MNIAYYILSDNHLPWVAFASVLSLNLIFPFPWGTISVFSETDGPCSKSLLGSSLFIPAHFSGEYKLGGFDLSIRNSMVSFCITVILCCRIGSLQDSTCSQGWLTPLDFTIFLIISSLIQQTCPGPHKWGLCGLALQLKVVANMCMSPLAHLPKFFSSTSPAVTQRPLFRPKGTHLAEDGVGGEFSSSRWLRSTPHSTEQERQLASETQKRNFALTFREFVLAHLS